MPRRHIRIVAAWATLWLAILPVALAQGKHGGGHTAVPHAAKPPKPPKPARAGKSLPGNNAPTAVDEFERMTPEQRQKVLSQLPPERAEKLRKKLQQFQTLTPQQQAVARQQLETFRHLPPERQESMRKAFDRFSKASPERQQAIRQELNQIGGMSAAERQARLVSPDFKGRFNNNEQKIISEMSDLQPE